MRSSYLGWLGHEVEPFHGGRGWEPPEAIPSHALTMGWSERNLNEVELRLRKTHLSRAWDRVRGTCGTFQVRSTQSEGGTE